jgi:hypothetical protein
MADDTDVLIKYCDKARQEMRHIENTTRHDDQYDHPNFICDYWLYRTT